MLRLALSTIALLAFFAAPQPAAADTAPALGNTIKAVFVYDLGNHATAILNPGNITECGESGGPLSITECKVEGAQLDWTGPNGRQASVELTEFVYLHSDRERAWTEYIFKGTFSSVIDGVTVSSPMSVAVEFYDEEPERVWGDLIIKHFGTKHGFKGVRLR